MTMLRSEILNTLLKVLFLILSSDVFTHHCTKFMPWLMWRDGKPSFFLSSFHFEIRTILIENISQGSIIIF